jgi:adenosylcobinamide-phosphate synthase
MAHGLDIALSGPRSYDGALRDYPFVNGGGERTLEADDVDRAVAVLWKTWALCLGIACAVAIASYLF